MKITLAITAIVAIVILILLSLLGQKSQTGVALGMHEQKLSACSSASHCVNSDTQADAESFIEPLDITTPATALKEINKIITLAGGSIQKQLSHYLPATFSSKIFGFVDDLEIRVDSTEKKMHFRSESRVGKSDLGANRRRVEGLKQMFLATQEQAN